MTLEQKQLHSDLLGSLNETNDDKALYRVIVHALVTTSGYGTKPKATKEKADEIFYGIKNKPYQY